ncbi:transposable element Tcb1 transposase [Trichonephila clavipes]|nr:transposable element Tcb1 transposase [Trichonephila clavipes]
MQPHVLRLVQRLSGAISEQDNARHHTAKLSLDCLRTFATFPWPTRSPDLSPTEHIWDHLGRDFKSIRRFTIQCSSGRLW